MKNSILKQVAGIDVAKKELVIQLGRLHHNLSVELYGARSFDNDKKGFEALLQWVKENSIEQAPLRFVMEATGVYHEGLAYFLKERDYTISIVLPNKISAYIKTLELKTITDKTASQAICRFGLERQLRTWQKPDKVYKGLRQLSRERGQLIEERTLVKNQLHAEEAEAVSNKGSIKRMQERIKLLDEQEEQIQAEVAALIKGDEKVKAVVVLLCSVPGIGLLTAATILAETLGFEHIGNKRQLTSYAGLDVVEKQSGTSVKGKARISKRGNRYLRKAMYMAALAAMRCDERYKSVFARIVGRTGIKMKGAVAVQRRVLEMCYTVFKTNTAYDKNYLKPKEQQQGQRAQGMVVEQAA